MALSLKERLEKKAARRKRKTELTKKSRAERKANGGKSKWTAEERRKCVWLDHYKIKPGEIKNPEGVNRNPVTEAYKQDITLPLPEVARRSLGLPPGATILDGIVRRQINDALFSQAKDANKSAAEITDRVEGKSVTRMSGPAGEGLFPPTLNVTFVRKRV